MRDRSVRILGIVLLLVSVIGVVWVAGSKRVDRGPKELVSPGPVDPDAPEEYTTTASGLKYRIRRASDEPKPTLSDSVRVHYRGTFLDGRVFDSSYKYGDSVVFGLDGVIKGWTEGLQLVGEGGMIELIVPPELAYGERGTGGIPGNSTLNFLIELIEITAAPVVEMAEVPLTPGPVDEDAPEEFTETPSGLKYRILRKSDGPKPGRFDVITFHIRSWAEGDEKPMHDSYASKTPIRRGIQGLTPGSAEAMQLVSEGGMIEFIVPVELRPKDEKAPEKMTVPDQALRRIVELIDVNSLFSKPVAPEDIPEEFTVTETGLKYRVLRQTDGPRPTLSSRVTVNYIGCRSDGAEFDGTYNRGGPSQFSLNQGMIKAWPEALQLIGEGGIIEIEVPPHLGYGLLGKPPIIRPDETLIFAIELLKVH